MRLKLLFSTIFIGMQCGFIVFTFIGCGLSEAPPPGGAGGGLGLSLIYPPETGLAEGKALAVGDTLRAWLFQLGTNETDAYQQRPVLGDSTWVPVAVGQGQGETPVVLELPSPDEKSWWRLFVEADSLAGNTTFFLNPTDRERSVSVSLAPDTAVTDQFTIYRGFAASSLSETSGAPRAQNTVIYPVALENVRPLDGLALRFAVIADSCSILIDPGSRFFALGGLEVIDQDLERIAVSDTNLAAYQLQIVAHEDQAGGALLEPGNDVLFYIVVHGSNLQTGLCFDREEAAVFPEGINDPTFIGLNSLCDGVLVGIHSPNENPYVSGYPHGYIIRINWSLWGNSGDQVRIDLIYEGEACETIVEVAENNGEFAWPASRCNGEPGNYRARVSVPTGEYGDSGRFMINRDCIVSLTSQFSGEYFIEGQEIPINWNTEGLDCPSQLGIELYWSWDDESMSPIESRSLGFVPNTGSFMWTAEGSGNVFHGYYIGIDSSEGPSFAGPFSIAPDDPLFRQIPAGTFIMGSPADELGRFDEETQHEVTLTTSFEMASTEVTNQQYADLAQWAFDQNYCTATSTSLRDALDGATVTLLDLDDDLCEISFSDGDFAVDEGKANHPVRMVTWHGSVSYCDWLSLQSGLPRAYDHNTWQCNLHDPYNAQGYRLPTEAEWEYACRAGSQTAFANGEITNTECDDPSLNQIGWYCGNPEDYSHLVGQLNPNAWGLYDMHGNLFEWCNDYIDSYGGEETDPVGPDNPTFDGMVIRGGSGLWPAMLCRSANRFYLWLASPQNAFGDVGFRPVRSTN